MTLPRAGPRLCEPFPSTRSSATGRLLPIGGYGARPGGGGEKGDILFLLASPSTPSGWPVSCLLPPHHPAAAVYSFRASKHSLDLFQCHRIGTITSLPVAGTCTEATLTSSPVRLLQLPLWPQTHHQPSAASSSRGWVSASWAALQAPSCHYSKLSLSGDSCFLKLLPMRAQFSLLAFSSLPNKQLVRPN